MNQFIKKHAQQLWGILSGFDRVRFRGTQQFLANERGMMNFLWKIQVKLKEFTEYAQGVTAQVRQHVVDLAEAKGRPVEYIGSYAISKEDRAREIAKRDHIEEGLICVLTSVEPCYSHSVRPNSETKHLELRYGSVKCLHQYLYFIDPKFGFGHLRLETWFPFTMHVCLNGREWMCRELTRRGIDFVRRQNCVVAVEEIKTAQRILDAQVNVDWESLLNRLAKWAFPLHQTLLQGNPLHYYWSADDTEWASDLLFKSPRRLRELYPSLVRHATENLGSGDVLRFLGRPVAKTGMPHHRFDGEVLSDYRRREEGVRVKHRVNRNSIKMYDKQGSVLRVETTITNARDIKTFRALDGKPKSKAWRRMRKGVCDLPRRAEVSQAANDRYLDTLSAVEETTPLQKLTEKICQPTQWKGRGVRALRPLESEDQLLLKAVLRGEFTVNGFRNRDLRDLLCESTKNDDELRRQSARITRQLRLLRAHGLIEKLPKTHRYQLTKPGRTTITAILTALQSDAKKLAQLAA
jgi:ribosomal protein L21E